MDKNSLFAKVSASPTNPHQPLKARRFDVADIFSGPFDEPHNHSGEQALDEKLR